MPNDDPRPPMRTRPLRKLAREITPEEATQIFSMLREHAQQREQERANSLSRQLPLPLLAKRLSVSCEEEVADDGEARPLLNPQRGAVLFVAACIAAGVAGLMHGGFLEVLSAEAIATEADDTHPRP